MFCVEDPVADVVTQVGGHSVLRADCEKNGTAESFLLNEYISANESSQIDCLVLVDLEALRFQFERWTRELPNIKPSYAVKCNSDPTLLRVLSALGSNFDCASPAEMECIVALGRNPHDIIYSNPCKQNYALQHMVQRGIKLTVVDNLDEIEKVSERAPDAEVLLRIRCDDVNARCPMSCKFGAGPESWEVLLQKAKHLGVNMVGTHFHVGSGCSERGAFEKPIRQSREVFQLAAKMGFPPFKICNIGGGYPGMENGSDQPGSVTFEELASSIRTSLVTCFPNEEVGDVRFMAEPGRFFSAGSQVIACRVISKRKADDGNTQYTIAESVYGQMNAVLFDHAHFQPSVLRTSRTDMQQQQCSIYGMSSSKIDVVCKNVELPELDIGDWICFKCAGAYTSAAVSSFGAGANQSSRRIYVQIKSSEK